MSEKSIAEKMFLKHASALALFNGQAQPDIVAQLPAQLIDGGSAAADVVLMFAADRAQLELYFAPAAARLAENGALWIAYLKGTASTKTDIHRDILRRYASERGMTSVALIALDSNWSALRLKRTPPA